MNWEWQTGKPPHMVPVEVDEGDGVVILAKAIHGCDGTLPHWETLDGNTHYHPSRFRKWRYSKHHVCKEVMDS